MPRYVTPSTSALRQQHTKSYTFALNSLAINAQTIENTFQLGSTVNIKSVKLNSIVYPYAAPQIRYNDEKCFEFGADGYATVPYATARYQRLRPALLDCDLGKIGCTPRGVSRL